MRLLVFSDTHNSPERMIEVLQKESGVDAVLFLGDGARDADTLAEAMPQLPLYRAIGNCDFGSFDPAEGLAAFDGVLFFYTHGHNYGVKSGLERLAAAAKARGADVALYGHTHMACYTNIDGVHLFNPGSLTLPRGTGGATYGVIDTTGGTPLFEIRAVKK